MAQADESDKKYKSELAVRSPSRPKSPKSVREFVNERIGVQARDESHQKEIVTLQEEHEKSHAAALSEALVPIPYRREVILGQFECREEG